MKSKLRVVLAHCSGVEASIEPTCFVVDQVQSLKELVRILVDSTVDLVIMSPEVYDSIRFSKIYKKYNVPGIVLSPDAQGGLEILKVSQEENLNQVISENRRWILGERAHRENSDFKFWFEKLTLFTNRIVHTSKELFVTEIKNYFKENFKAERCHWVEVKEDSSRRPPILKLRQELSRQQVDQSSLIGVLDQCGQAFAANDDFQMWELSGGEFLALLWIPGPAGTSQCVVINKFKVDNSPKIESFFKLLMPFLIRRWSLCLQVSEAQEQVYRDSLTDLYNQKFLNEVLEKKMEENKRYHTPFSVLFIDVDHFKKVNDSMGHLVGSGVLKQLGEVLLDQIRNSDYAFRYGGDEFILLLSHTEGDEAVNVAERVRKKVENHLFSVNKMDVNITVSIGLAFYPEHAQSAEEIVRIADEAMYYGKNKSRNIVYKAS